MKIEIYHCNYGLDRRSENTLLTKVFFFKQKNFNDEIYSFFTKFSKFSKFFGIFKKDKKERVGRERIR